MLLLPEQLRNFSDPSVSDLLLKRARQLAEHSKPDSNAALLQASQGCEIGEVLAAWDAPASSPLLVELFSHCEKAWELTRPRRGQERLQCGRWLARLAILLGQQDDQTLLKRYAHWFRNQTSTAMYDHAQALLQPFWRFPEQPDLAETARWVFEAKDSPWIPFIDAKQEEGSGHIQYLLGKSPLICVPAYRSYVLRELENLAVAGTTKVHSESSVNYSIHHAWSTATSSSPGDPLRPPIGSENSFRIADGFAFRLASLPSLPDVPKFKLYWPEKRRDATIAELKEFLNRSGDKYTVKPYLGPASQLHDKPQLVIPQSNEPSTPEEDTGK